MKDLKFRILISFLIGIAIVFNACQSDNSFTITGKVKGIPDQKIYLKYNDLETDEVGIKKTFATTQIKNGEFEFTGEIKSAPIEFYIELEKKMKSSPNISIYQFAHNHDQFILINNSEKAVVTITKAEDQSKISMVLGEATYSERPIVLEMKVIAAPLQDEYHKITGIINKKFRDKRNKLFEELYRNTKATNNRKKDSLQVLIDKITDDETVFNKQYINKHSNSVVAFKVFQRTNLKPEERKEVYNSFSQEVKNSHIALLYNHHNALYEKQEKDLKIAAETVKTGNPFIDFSAKDNNEKNIQFSSFINSKNKYVLLDFWASWCAPCRKENPNLLKAYKKYKEKGLEIIALSLDKGQKDWLKAIEEENMPWVQLHDKKAFNGIAKQYAVNAIPDNFLIDCSSGLIIARNLREGKLHEKLNELFVNRK